MKFLLTGHLPDNYQPTAEDEACGTAIHALNDEMEGAGALFFAGGLYPAAMAKTVSVDPNGDPLVTDGPYLETKEHVGGLLIIDADSLEAALEWAKKGAKAGRRPVEVRQIFFHEG